jgi:hypothetical protein
MTIKAGSFLFVAAGASWNIPEILRHVEETIEMIRTIKQ